MPNGVDNNTMEAIANDFLEMIRDGDLDKSLGTLRNACNSRLAVLGREMWEEKPDDFRVHQIVEVVGKLRPNYLLGYKFEVVKVNPKTVKVDVPDNAAFGRFRGKKVGIPKTAVKVVG